MAGGAGNDGKRGDGRMSGVMIVVLVGAVTIDTGSHRMRMLYATFKVSFCFILNYLYFVLAIVKNIWYN